MIFHLSNVVNGTFNYTIFYDVCISIFFPVRHSI
ncbi:MAG: hypothetical protein Edafosvirus6_53 [Edafosvirus sp.]|uniref:Uncharacterized protein n=1 Tax=Edafosvirus sp. TaxID=2487765 RepID=A0A3G4ZV48_9VIRU|nr:MAG: hypothetical protein Edafosvirus6_53 [Edafosvirus sp.]